MTAPLGNSALRVSTSNLNVSRDLFSLNKIQCSPTVTSNKVFIITLTLVGYEMIIINSMLHALLAIHRLKANLHSWNNC